MEFTLDSRTKHIYPDLLWYLIEGLAPPHRQTCRSGYRLRFSKGEERRHGVGFEYLRQLSAIYRRGDNMEVGLDGLGTERT